MLITAHRGAVVAALGRRYSADLRYSGLGWKQRRYAWRCRTLSPANLRRAEAGDVRDRVCHGGGGLGRAELAFPTAPLYTPAQRPRMLALIRTMHDNVGRYLRVYPALIQQQHYSQQEHQQLLAACQAQDEQAALRILRQHLEGASERLAAFVATQQTSGAVPESSDRL